MFFLSLRVADVKSIFDFVLKKCSNNIGLQTYGSDAWGQDVGCDWSFDFDQRFD